MTRRDRHRHSSHNDTYGNGLVSAFLTTYFLACGAGAVTSFMTTSQLAAFMNGWEHFVFQFPVTFPGQFANFQFIQRISIFLFAYTVGLFLILFITAFYIYRICLLDSSGSCTWIEREQSLFFLGFGSASVINSTFEQYKVAIMMHTVARAFYEVTRIAFLYNFLDWHDFTFKNDHNLLSDRLNQRYRSASIIMQTEN